ADQTTETEETSYPNLLEERQQIPLSQVNAQLNDAFSQLFFGDPNTQAVFVDLGDGSGYIEDIANGDVRTDSMAYGLLTTVQLNQREVFDKLWAWAKQYMMSPSGASQGLLRWRCDTTGTECEPVAATDAQTIIATTLFIAETRWAEAGAHDYQSDALDLLDAMTAIEERNGGVVDGVVNCFDMDALLPREDSVTTDAVTPVDYLTPAFYEIWAAHDPERADVWRDMADNARDLLSKISDPTTGLYPEFITYEGEPVADLNNYSVTTARTLLNLALDHMWNGPHDWAVEQNERILNFFLSKGLNAYVASYTIDGQPLLTYNTLAHQSLVALAAGTSPNRKYDPFLEALLKQPIPTGQYRYYDGM
ncbi:MAG TPA: glycosyl hydrolase family 8, partial [Polyangiaceae bacterium]|nr:glycosyl hydrolase family 8 [Polyangiaceae bacterium]